MLGYDRAARFTLHKPSATHASFQRSTCLPFCLPKTNSPTLDDIPLKASGYSHTCLPGAQPLPYLAHHRVASAVHDRSLSTARIRAGCTPRDSNCSTASQDESSCLSRGELAAVWQQHHRGLRAGFMPRRRRLPSADAASSTMPSCASCSRPSATLTRPSSPSGAMLCVRSRRSASPTFPRRAPLDSKQLAMQHPAAPHPHRHQHRLSCRPEKSIYRS